MPSAHIIRRLQHSPEGLFSLVANVEDYPKFIDLISALRITKKLSATEFEAEAIVAYKMIRETFQSHVSVDPERLKITVKKAEKGGAVKALLNGWAFYPLEDGSTLVDVLVDVRLKARPLEFLLRDKFDKASVHIVDSFQTRASKTLALVGSSNYDFLPEFKALDLDDSKLV